eukprot:COSAG05_NODE_568_length_8638_cov_8.593395_6_plen_857_part_00
MDVTKWIRELASVLKAACKEVGVPSSICKIIPQSAINKVLDDILKPVDKALKAITTTLHDLIDKIPNASAEAAFSAGLKFKKAKIAGHFSFLAKLNSMSVKLNIGTKDNPIELGLGKMAAEIGNAVVKGLKGAVIELAKFKPNQAKKVLDAELKKAKTELIQSGKAIFKDAKKMVGNVKNALKNAYKGMKSAAKFLGSEGDGKCGSDANFGFQRCRDCDETPKGQRGARRQHRVTVDFKEAKKQKQSKQEACFASCLKLSMDIYDKWTDATTYEAVKLDMSHNNKYYTKKGVNAVEDKPTYANGRVIANTARMSECEIACTSDVDCVGWSYYKSRKICWLAFRLPTMGPWKCTLMQKDGKGSSPSWNCDKNHKLNKWSGSRYTKTIVKNVDECGEQGACFFRRVNSKFVSYKFDDKETDTAVVRDWTTGACCRLNRNKDVCIFAPGAGKSTGVDAANFATGQFWCDTTGDPNTRCKGLYTGERGSEDKDCAGKAGGTKTMDSCDECKETADHCCNKNKICKVKDKGCTKGGQNACDKLAVLGQNGVCKFKDSSDNNKFKPCVKDCAKKLGGTKTKDACGQCKEKNEHCCNGERRCMLKDKKCKVKIGKNWKSCVKDCANTVGGTKTKDACGQCKEKNEHCCNRISKCMLKDKKCKVKIGKNWKSCVKDCKGVLGGNAKRDRCNVCRANPKDNCAKDCFGKWGGSAKKDNCKVCRANPKDNCKQDCAKKWGGSAKIDKCNVCRTKSKDHCKQDCLGKWGGSAKKDKCNVCRANPKDNCKQDCEGKWGGPKRKDNCKKCRLPENHCCKCGNGKWSENYRIYGKADGGKIEQKFRSYINKCVKWENSKWVKQNGKPKSC